MGIFYGYVFMGTFPALFGIGSMKKNAGNAPIKTYP